MARFLPKYGNYTPLVHPVSQILMAIQKHPSLRWPASQNLPAKGGNDQGEYCRFHHYVGHDTDNCTALKNEIKRLVQSADLTDFTKPGPVRPNT